MNTVRKRPHGWTGADCPKCGGHGMVKDAISETACLACAGTGEEYIDPPGGTPEPLPIPSQ